jgi:hypothetical protein
LEVRRLSGVFAVDLSKTYLHAGTQTASETLYYSGIFWAFLLIRIWLSAGGTADSRVFAHFSSIALLESEISYKRNG